MSEINLRHRLCGCFFLLSCILLQLACGKKVIDTQITDDDNVHINFSARASTMLLGVTDAQISEITVQRLNCPEAGEPVDYLLRVIPSEKLFVLNEQRALIEGCELRVRKLKLVWKELQVEFTTLREQQTSAQTFETVLANPSKNAFLNVVTPYKLSIAIERNIFWSMNVSYTDSRIRLFPIVAEAREANVKPLGLSISSLEDRGEVNSIWREFGLSLSCGAVQSLGTCNDYELMGLRARIVPQSDVDIGVAEQIRFQGSTNNLLFTAGLTHILGSGLRFTIALPLAHFGQKLYLILTRGQGYTVFDLQPELIPAAPQ